MQEYPLTLHRALSTYSKDYIRCMCLLFWQWWVTINLDKRVRVEWIDNGFSVNPFFKKIFDEERKYRAHMRYIINELCVLSFSYQRVPFDY